jgi:hypothetical protein
MVRLSAADAACCGSPWQEKRSPHPRHVTTNSEFISGTLSFWPHLGHAMMRVADAAC